MKEIKKGNQLGTWGISSVQKRGRKDDNNDHGKVYGNGLSVNRKQRMINVNEDRHSVFEELITIKQELDTVKKENHKLISMLSKTRP